MDQYQQNSNSHSSDDDQISPSDTESDVFEGTSKKLSSYIRESDKIFYT